MVTVPAEAYVEGTGVLKALAPGLQPTWSDLATLMITVSDNTATNLIIDRLGMEIQGWIDKAGLVDTRMERRMMDRAPMSAGNDDTTSASDMERLLIAIAASACVSKKASRSMQMVLEAQQIQDRLSRRLGEDVRTANKTGNFAATIHDIGIVTWNSNMLAIAALTQALPASWQAMDAIADIAKELLRISGSLPEPPQPAAALHASGPTGSQRR